MKDVLIRILYVDVKLMACGTLVIYVAKALFVKTPEDQLTASKLQ